jgi:hypothetical protein
VGSNGESEGVTEGVFFDRSPCLLVGDVVGLTLAEDPAVTAASINGISKGARKIWPTVT